MFKKQKKSRIINSFNNIYHLEKESNINVGISYLLLVIPIIVLVFSAFLSFFYIYNLNVPFEFLVVITAFINLYRFSWTYKDSLRCVLTFLGAVICFFIFNVFFNNSPLSSAPASGFVNWLVSEIQKYPSNLYDYGFPPSNEQLARLLSNNYNFQTLMITKLQSFLSLLYAHAIYVFIIHYQVRETQTMMNFYNLGIEPKLIADYILDPENNKKIEEEALYRYSLNLDKINRGQDRPKITKSESIYFEKDDELNVNNKVYKNNLVNPTTPEPAWDEDKLSPQNNKDYLEDNNLDNKKKRFFNSTSSYFNSLRSENEFDQNLEEDDSDENKKD